MKKATFITLVFLTVLSANSETITNAFLFPEFQKGKVYFKNNTIVSALLNYQTVSKEMLFNQNNQVLALGLTNTIDSVVIAGRIFVNYEKCEFFEKVPVGNGYLFIQFNSVLLSNGKQAGYGGYSQVSSVKSINRMTSVDGGNTYDANQISVNENFKTKTYYSFWIKKNNKFVEINSQNRVLKTFPDNKPQVQDYFAKHKIDFESLDDMTKLSNYCFIISSCSK